MPAFPSLDSGAITQLPFGKARAFRTDKVRMPCGLQYSWQHRTLPLLSWTIALTSITEDEVETYRDFFELVGGRRLKFDFYDPDTDSTYTVRFDQDTFRVRYLGPDQCSVDLALIEDKS